MLLIRQLRASDIGGEGLSVLNIRPG